ncbi:MAG: hypothetical protein JSW63_12575 [Ignavibacterium sp.]|nr:MAG: hypothetical protein JSW63_12575 [Ignavibacterium sp.]
MEPKVLLIGRSKQVVDILKSELKNYGRDIIGTENNKEAVYQILRSHQVDIVVIGAGLPDDVRMEIKEFIIALRPGLPVNLIKRTPDSNPQKMIDYVNQKVAEFKEMRKSSIDTKIKETKTNEKESEIKESQTAPIVKTGSGLHYTIIKHIIEKGYAPDIETLSNIMNSDVKEVGTALFDLQDEHGVVLHPNQPKIWVIHPFALAPTNFIVKSSKGLWWGNCAWCSLGIAALLKDDASITTNLGAHGEQVIIHIKGGEVQEKDLYIHFPIPMKYAWDNVIYTCSNMLVFKDENQIDLWTKRHNIPKGDIQTIDKIWKFSKKWYGNHLDPNWKKWTKKEAREIFLEFNLTHEVWDLENSDSRF